jgi:hypothetical protein
LHVKCECTLAKIDSRSIWQEGSSKFIDESVDEGKNVVDGEGYDTETTILTASSFISITICI